MGCLGRPLEGAPWSAVPGPVAFPIGVQGTVLEIACGNEHVLARTSAGAVYTWGSGELGRLGHGDEDDRPLPERVAFLTADGREFAVPVQGIAAGDANSA